MSLILFYIYYFLKKKKKKKLVLLVLFIVLSFLSKFYSKMSYFDVHFHYFLFIINIYTDTEIYTDISIKLFNRYFCPYRNH